MYKQQKIVPTTINTSKNIYEGETIENKMRRIINNKEPISDGAPVIYTERKNGVQPEYDIRTDRFEIALDAFDKIQATYKAQREQRIKDREEPKVIDIKTETKNPETGANTSDNIKK